MKNKNMILVTGAAGFIGFHLCKTLLNQNFSIVGIDNLNDYYDVNLKYDRLKELGVKIPDKTSYNESYISELYNERFKFIKINIEDRENLPTIFKKYNFTQVCNLAAQAGVRYSLENPETYIDSNISGFLNILECCRNFRVPRLIYASSSSVYGNEKKIPYSEKVKIDKPISLYAATKTSNELMAHTYSHLYNIECIGLRFFTVYGPWGRPDMAIFLFTKAIISNKPIKVFNKGNLSRDFTFIDDVIDGVMKIISCNKSYKDKNRIYNIGNNEPVKLLDFITEIEKNLKIKSKKKMLSMQPGDVKKTWSDISLIKEHYGYLPKTKISHGIKKFISWFEDYNK